MAVTSKRTTNLVFTGDVVSDEPIPAGTNTNSPGSIDVINLAIGANTITVPTGGTVPTAVTILPPVGNILSIILKGITGDTGIRIHNTDPTTIALDPSVTSFVLTATAIVTGVRLYWS